MKKQVSLGIKIPLSKVPLLRNISFWKWNRNAQLAKNTPNTRYIYKKTKKIRVYLVSDCVICVHRQSRNTEPGNCTICGKTCSTWWNPFW